MPRRIPLVAPAVAHIGDQCRHFLVTQLRPEGRHAEGIGIACRRGREAAIEYRADGIDRLRSADAWLPASGG
jgi:hypothetical protein